MPEVLLPLVPLMLGSAILPSWISLIVLLLRSPRGTTKALSFVSAVTAVRLLQGLGAGEVLRKAAGLVHGLDVVHLIPAMVLLAGVILIVVGIHGLIRGGRRADQPPRWYGLLREAGALKCGAAGAVLILISPRQWVLTLAAVGVIRDSNLSVAQEVVTFLIFTAGAESLILAPIAWGLINRDRPHKHLAHHGPWFRRGRRWLAGVGSILVGAYFLWRGIAALFGG